MTGVVVGAVYVLMGATLMRPSDKNQSPDKDTRSVVDHQGWLDTCINNRTHRILQARADFAWADAPRRVTELPRCFARTL
jgi:hypothetical protein